MGLCSEKHDTNVDCVFSLADYAKSNATPGSQLEAELKEDTYDTVPPQGGVEQYSEHSLPDAPGSSANYNEYFDLSDDNESDDEEMFPLVRASELKENSPDVETLLHHKPSNNTSIKIGRLSSKVDSKNITHSTEVLPGLKKAHRSEVRLFEAASTSFVWGVKLHNISRVQSGIFELYSASKTPLTMF